MYGTHMRVLYHFCCRQSHSSVVYIKLKSQPKLLHSAQPLMQKPQHNSKSINPMGSLVDFNLIAVRDWHNWERLQFLIGINYFFHIFLRCDGRWAGRGISTIWLAEACDVNDYLGRYFNLPRNFADRIHSQNKDRSSLNPQKLKVFSFQPKEPCQLQENRYSNDYN